MTSNQHALPHLIGELPDYLRDLAASVANTLDVDFGMALATLLSGMASGVHGVKAVRRPDGGLENLALFFVVLSGSGTGKTRTHKLVHAPHSEHDVRRYSAYQEAKLTGSQARLRDVIQPLTNNRSLLGSLEGIGHSTAISTHEGKSVLSSYFFRQQLDVANVFWDGDDKVALPLSTGDRLLAFNACLNILLMIQHEPFQAYLQKHGEAARSIGFLPRCLFTIASGDNAAVRHLGSPRDLEEYYKDVTAHLESQFGRLNRGAGAREEIVFSPAACAYWFQLEQDLKQHGYRYYFAQDTVARALQNATRLAGVIHSYRPFRADDSRLRDGDERGDEISVQTLRAAWAIVDWHLGQFVQVFHPAPTFVPCRPEPTAHEKRERKIAEDAETIMAHFGKHCFKTGNSEAPQSEIVTRSGLYLARFKAALFFLTDQNFLVAEGSGRKARLRAGTRPYVATAQSNIFGTAFRL